VNLFPDDGKHPSGGERVTNTAGDAIRLAHKALDRFPDVVKRHKFIAGGAAISSSLVALAGVAITRRMRSGQTEEEALASITEEELSGRRVELPGDKPTNGDGPPDTSVGEHGGVEVESVPESEFDVPAAEADVAALEGEGVVPVEPRP
jgi:hypothetical protein